VRKLTMFLRKKRFFTENQRLYLMRTGLIIEIGSENEKLSTQVVLVAAASASLVGYQLEQDSRQSCWAERITVF
jgi:hypothetical protein